MARFRHREQPRSSKRVYCEYCEKSVSKSELEMHRIGERHISTTRQPGYWNNVDALISQLPSLTEFDNKKYRKNKK